MYNLISFIRYDISYGIKNLIRWFPVIWRDRDWDWVFLAEIMEYKLRKMSYGFKHYGKHSYHMDDARNTLICAELLKRLREDNPNDIKDKSYYIHEVRMNEWQKMLGRYLGKYLRNWWD